MIFKKLKVLPWQNYIFQLIWTILRKTYTKELPVERAPLVSSLKGAL